MGNCASSGQAEGKARSDMIDRQIEEDAKKYKRECKILLLGAYTSYPPSFSAAPRKCKEKVFIRPTVNCFRPGLLLFDDGRQRDPSFDISHVTGSSIS
jgi:guanine nucleotide-binding protein G(i) subunit alpha